MSFCNLHRPLMLALMFVGLSGSLFAVDGIILIDQNRALAGNVTPGDFPGFPISITQPGSYRLSGNLDAPLNTRAVLISAKNVSLDLNGFTVKCTADQTVAVAFSTFSCIGDGGNAISDVTIRNGSVNSTETGVGGQLSTISVVSFFSSPRITIESLSVQTASDPSVFVFTLNLGAFSIVRDTIIFGSGFNGVNRQCPSLFTGNINQTGGTGGGGVGCVLANNIGLF